MSGVVTNRRLVFWNAARLALKDGHLSNGEKRILVKLSHALKLSEEEPKMVYDCIVDNETPEGGGDLDEREMRLVYEQVLEGMLIHTDRSDPVIAQIAHLRSIFGIEETEHRAITRSLDWQLEEIVHRPFIDEFRERLRDSVQRAGEIFDSVNILVSKEQR